MGTTQRKLSTVEFVSFEMSTPQLTNNIAHECSISINGALIHGNITLCVASKEVMSFTMSVQSKSLKSVHVPRRHQQSAENDRSFIILFCHIVEFSMIHDDDDDSKRVVRCKLSRAYKCSANNHSSTDIAISFTNMEIKCPSQSELPWVVQQAHYESVLRRSTSIRQLFDNDDENLAQEYYQESLMTLVHSFDIQNYRALWDILREFSNEVICDLCLKNICFKSRDIIAECVKICHETMNSAPPDTFRKLMRQLPDDDDFELKSPLRRAKSIDSAAILRELHIILKQRLQTIRLVLQLLAHVLFGSATIHSRQNIISIVS